MNQSLETCLECLQEVIDHVSSLAQAMETEPDRQSVLAVQQRFYEIRASVKNRLAEARQREAVENKLREIKP
jgi:hypothetical protein